MNPTLYYSDYIRAFLLLSVLAVAAVTDAAYHKVSNYLIFPSIFIMTVFQLFFQPEYSGRIPGPLLLSAAFILILFLLYSMGMIGGADVKLYILTIIAYPGEKSLYMIILSMFMSAVYGIYLMTKYKIAAERFLNLKTYISRALSGIREPYYDRQQHPDLPVIPMGVSIFLAACVVLLT